MPPVAEQFVSTRALTRRGWTYELRRDVLGCPDAIVDTTGGNERHLYLLARVLEAERRPEVACVLLSYWSHQQRTAGARAKYYRDQLWRDKRGSHA